MGMLLVSSSVKTLENCALRTSSLSLSSVALVPSGFSKSGIEALVVRVELTYLQNSLLLFLISLDTLECRLRGEGPLNFLTFFRAAYPLLGVGVCAPYPSY